MKKVLILTYYWPPSGGSGVQRWMCFSKYLADFGYSPIVITVAEEKASYKNIDTSLNDEVKDVRVFRTNTREPLRLYSKLTKGDDNSGIPQGHIETTKKGVFYKVSNFVRGNFFIPDARVGWNSFAFKQAKEILESEKIDILVTTGPPHSTHLIGLKLKRNFNVKWVADLRDPWSDIYYNKDLPRTNWAKQKDLSLEKNVLLNADMVLTIGNKLKELLQKKLPGSEAKFKYIYNGFDSFLMDSVKKQEHDFFTITFIGLLTQNQPYQSLIKSIKAFVEKTNDPKIKLLLAGNIQEKIIQEFKSELPNLNIETHGYVPHSKSIEYMKSSQLLLNCLAEMENSEILISGKQMEYIASGNPILCIGDRSGESALILNDIPNAKTFQKQEVADAAQFISFVYENWKANKTLKNDSHSDTIKSKSRYETTRQLAELFNNLY